MRSLVMCTTCRFSADAKTGPDGRTGGEVLISHMREAMAERGGDQPVIQPQSCLWNCNRPCSVILRDESKFTYITGGHEPTREQAEAILDWFAMHGESATGEVPFKQWPLRMKGHFIARLPKAEA